MKKRELIRELDRTLEGFDLAEKAFVEQWRRESRIWRTVSKMGGKFRGRIGPVMQFEFPTPPVELEKELQEHPREGWTLNGTELLVEL